MMRILILMTMFILASCGDSPLLNHKMEGSLGGIIDPVLTDSDSFKFDKTNYSFQISWQIGPQMGESKFIMKTWNKDLGTMNGPYQDLDKNFNIFLWMPSMGHGSVPVKIKRIADGEYEVSSVQFIMGGKWQIKFQLMKDNQVFNEVIVPITI